MSEDGSGRIRTICSGSLMTIPWIYNLQGPGHSVKEKAMTPLLIESPPDLLIIFVVVMLIFGGKKLPELARGSGRALRIFKSEVSGLDDERDRSRPVSRSTDLEETQAPQPTALERHEADHDESRAQD